MNGNGETESTHGIELILIIFRSLNVGNVYYILLYFTQGNSIHPYQRYYLISVKVDP